jgi:hypothetical protein
MLSGFSFHHWVRSLRGWGYRWIPPLRGEWGRKRFAGYERRWNMEVEGFTKEGFFVILQKKLLTKARAGNFYELVAGDGQVGSLGVWLERSGGGWRVEAWEHRSHPLAALRENRPATEIHGDRLTSWSEKERKAGVVGITTRGAREASGVCREIRKRRIRPYFVGIWNPTMRPIWSKRMEGSGYNLALVYQRMEFYVSAETRGQIQEDRCRK